MDDQHVRILIVDDHPMVASALAVALSQEATMTVAGVAHSVADVDTITEHHPDPHDVIHVAVVDFHLPDGTGVDVAYLLAARRPATRIVMVSADSSPEQLRRFHRGRLRGLREQDQPVAGPGPGGGERGARRCVVRRPRPADPHSAPPSPTPRPRPRRPASRTGSGRSCPCSPAGLSTEVMAVELYLSQHTARNHVRNLTAKLGAHSRLEAVAIAARAGLITLVPTQ